MEEMQKRVTSSILYLYATTILRFFFICIVIFKNFLANQRLWEITDSPKVILLVSSGITILIGSFGLQRCIFLQLHQVVRKVQFSSIQFSRSVMSNSLQPHESQHARPPCPSPTPGVHLDSRPSGQWCHPAISSSVVPFSCPQSLSASECFPMSQHFAWGGQSTGVSASASFLPKNTQGWSPSEWTGWISLKSKGLSRVFANTTVQKHQFFGTRLSSQSNSHIHTWPLEKP